MEDVGTRAFVGIVKRSHRDGESRVVRIVLDAGGEWSLRVAPELDGALFALGGERLRFVLDPESNVIVAVEKAA